MTDSVPEDYAAMMAADFDRKNMANIDKALDAGKINQDAADYLRKLYSNSMVQFREVFYFLGKCLGAPKAAVMPYDYENDCATDNPTRIADITPSSPYIVNHRLDADPMRNQFFSSGDGHKIDLSVSSIVTVIVAAQKSLDRALDKITGKYYTDYVNEVAQTAHRVLVAAGRDASGRAIEEKIREKFAEKYISNASETVLTLIGRGHEKIAVEMVRALDKIETPHERLQDVWRVKCLFDLVPQARTFMERLYVMMPDRIISSRDKFYDMENPRNYRDAKIIINISKNPNQVIPMEIICQVRTFFEFERKTHGEYEAARKKKCAKSDSIEAKMASFMEDGIKEYNKKICDCLEDLFDRVGWNILYGQDGTVSMFEGFPKECKLYYPQKVLDNIMEKLEDAITNEVFRVCDAPAKLTPGQQSEIFRFMSRFVLVAAMPYMQRDWAMPADTQAGKLFNFVMKEVQRYYKKSSQN
ncbi:MAG: hypothetical protein IJ276_02730 [Alphaproteobacteria bacterium]|nr:hypothetical protein [Alphaproteobacteria bacterium]MBR2482288.1 hypothetical protein [Alphaproteobacteria bacterium]